MRPRFPSLSWLNHLFAIIREIRWRDPLAQTWGLMGGLLMMGIVSHYVPGRDAGEKKNPSPVEALFLTKNLAPRDQWRPAVAFSSQKASAAPPGLMGAPDLRAFAGRAAQEPEWHHVAPTLLSDLHTVSEGLPLITVSWSGTRGGDAGALDLYHRKTLGQSGGLPEDFVIGNGCRGKDGGIETTARWEQTLTAAVSSQENRGISICLVGEGGKPTPAQEAALGELITAIEARAGTTALAMRQPRHEGLLAWVDGKEGK